MFLHAPKQILRLSDYLLLRPCSPKNSKKVFSHSNLRNNFVQVLNTIHSNVQLLNLLLVFAVVVGVAVFLAKGP